MGNVKNEIGKEEITVLYDYQAFHTQRFGGISRYFFELLTRMSGAKTVVSLKFSMNRYIDTYQGKSHISVPVRLFKIFGGMFRKMNRACSLSTIRKGNFDIFHPTYYDPYFLEALGNKPFVLTIHDMTHERFPQHFSEKDRTAVNKRLLAERAKRIIAISESTKKDILEFYPDLDESKIDVVYHGIGHTPIAEGRPRGLPEKYILYVGERRRYKNFENTAKAFSEVHKVHNDCYLVLTGRPVSETEASLFTSLGVSDYVKAYTDMSDEVLYQLYHHATLFVYPSLYEGFGIPILEAFSQDCPVVLSNASCFPEVAADAGEYFEPLDVSAQVKALLHVMDDDEYRQELIAKGRERVAKFTWDETARQTRLSYEAMLRS